MKCGAAIRRPSITTVITWSTNSTEAIKTRLVMGM
jgi:hypothetical protein